MQITVPLALLSAALSVAALAGCRGAVDSSSPPASTTPGTEPDVVVDGPPPPTTIDVPEPGQCDGDLEELVARTPLRRLTQTYYRNSVRDIFDIDASQLALPVDERAGTFAGNVASSVTEVHVRRYRAAAQDVAREAVARREAWASCAPADAGCADTLAADIGRKLWRRPLNQDDIASLRALFELGASAEAGMRLMLEGMLQAPDFLYLVEDQSAERQRALARHELAARLSYFLWATTPNERLLAAAEAGELDSAQGLRAYAEGMLDDDRLREGLAAFVVPWLGLEGFDRITKSSKDFPYFDGAMREAMFSETLDFTDWVVRRGDARLDTLMTARFSIIDEPLLRLYGVAAPQGWTPSEPIAMPPERAGLLTQASVLAAHAHASHTSPVSRGVFILRNLLCVDLPTPTFEIPELPEPDPAQTTRERFEAHTEVEACATCHRIIDPVGLGFERFDAIGQWRDDERGKPVDDGGTLAVGIPEIDGEFRGGAELSARLATAPPFYRCTTAQWTSLALQRPVTSADVCAIDDLYTTFLRSGGDLRELMLAIVTSPSFRLSPSRIEE